MIELLIVSIIVYALGSCRTGEETSNWGNMVMTEQKQKFISNIPRAVPPIWERPLEPNPDEKEAELELKREERMKTILLKYLEQTKDKRTAIEQATADVFREYRIAPGCARNCFVRILRRMK
jgi:hypothetical protein